MARSQAVQVENNFSKGLVTENTALSFPENACTDALNCVFDETGRVSRRKAIDVEDEFIAQPVFEDLGDANVYTEYVWTDVNGQGTLSFLVQQVGNYIHFFDISEDSHVSRQFITRYDLNNYKASGTPHDPRVFLCQYTQGNGDLLIVNRACDPIYVSYNAVTDSFTIGRITVKYRDFTGLESPYADKTRPAFATVADLVNDSSGAKHYYNLLNQGWWQGGVSGGSPAANSALGQWDTAFANFPSNNDAVAFYRASNTDPLDPTRVGAFDQGNTLAPKGHFILDFGNADRYNALTTEGYSLTFSTDVETFVENTAGVSFGSISVAQIDKVFDGVTTGATDNTVSVTTAGPQSIMYFGKEVSPSKKFNKAVVYATKKIGNKWTFGSYNSVDTTDGYLWARVHLYGSNTAPTSYNNGTLLASKTVFSGVASVTLTIPTPTNYSFLWVVVMTDTTADPGLISTTAYCSEVKFYELITKTADGALPDADVTPERFSCTAFFASRAWYAGVEKEGLSNNIYYSQIIEKKSQYGKCYQVNDPTSEFSSTVLPTDGGVIKISEMGKVYKLLPFQSALMVFASNGVWIIGSNGGFTATDFFIKRISTIGTQSPLSFVDVKGVPVWWAEEGIHQVNYNPQFDSFSVENISENNIRSFFFDIPADKRNFVKGAYDIRDGVVYWLYEDSTTAQTSGTTYTKMLCLNTKSGAFYPFATPQGHNAKIRGIVYAQDSTGNSDPKIKLTFNYHVSTTTIRFNYAEFKDNGLYTDWVTFASRMAVLDSITSQDYESYFVTGYKIHGEAIKFFQVNYLKVFMEKLTNSSLYVQGIFDFTDSGDSGKWTNPQQCYRSSVLNRSIITSRLKIRGRGISVQFKFTSESGKPFTVIGWSGFETANREV